MKKRSTIIMVLFFFMGLLVLLYPAVSDFHNQKVQSKSIVDYEAILENIDKNKYDDIFNKAYDYNNRLKGLEDQLYDFKKLNDYNDVLNINNRGMMGYISIKKIKLELPIYHGTSEETLSGAVGHLEGTSLPVGGESTHSVISAHRGLASSLLFTNLDKLEIGDVFTITILDRLSTYEIDKILIVDPKDVKDLRIEERSDYVTLVTCTPYGINSHRLLVRGKRIENIKEKMYVSTEAFKVSPMIVTPLVALPIIFLILIIIVFQPVEYRLSKIKQKYVYPCGGMKNVK